MRRIEHLLRVLCVLKSYDRDVPVAVMLVCALLVEGEADTLQLCVRGGFPKRRVLDWLMVARSLGFVEICGYGVVRVGNAPYRWRLLPEGRRLVGLLLSSIYGAE